jgi:hypothetical protein
MYLLHPFRIHNNKSTGKSQQVQLLGKTGKQMKGVRVKSGEKESMTTATLQD